MSAEPQFDRSAPGRPGEIVDVAPRVRRIIAPNPGPFTFTGTCTYIVGRGRVAIIDPGPESSAHREAILGAVNGEEVAAILVTHTHRDHSPGAAALVSATGAPTYGAGPHPAPQLPGGGLDNSGDMAFKPGYRLGDGDAVHGPDWHLEAVATPGHCSNHLAFALDGGEILFSGDHVMGWSTSIVAPPDGVMNDYVASLQRLLARREEIYLPGHGNPIPSARRYVQALIDHRHRREETILAALAAGDTTIRQIVERVYAGLGADLVAAAQLTTLAHLQALAGRNVVAVSGEPGLDAAYNLATAPA